MNNQRKESRKKFMAFTPVYDLNHKLLLGYIGDLTMKGAMVVGEKSVEVGNHHAYRCPVAGGMVQAGG
jgi:hypothetical protein